MIRHQLMAGLPALLLFSCLSPPWVGSARPWARADEFTGGLRCDMTEAEITEHARSFPRLHLHHPDGRQELLVGKKGDTLIHLELEGGNLETYQVSWTSGLTKQSHALKTDLCSGQKLVELHIIGDSKHAGAAVLLDGERIGELPSHGTTSFDISLGVHTLALDRRGSIWVAELRYDLSSSGYDRLPIPEDAFVAAEADGYSLEEESDEPPDPPLALGAGSVPLPTWPTWTRYHPLRVALRCARSCPPIEGSPSLQ